MNKLRVAIYSGVIPSTTFIENLILSLAQTEVEIFLFGTVEEKVVYPFNNIHVIGNPVGKWLRVWFTINEYLKAVFKNRLRLKILLKYSRKQATDRKSRLMWLSRTLPVINNLPDVFHVQWAKSAPEWVFLKDLFNVKLVLSLRGAHINYSPLADLDLAERYRQSFPNYDGFHAVSHAIKIEASKYGAESNRTRVIYTGIDTEKVNQIRDQNLLKSVDPNSLNILSVGRFHWKKGYNYAIEAMNLLLKDSINFHYTIIASGENTESKFQILDLGLEDKVTILPGLSHEEVLFKMNTCDIFLLPSLEEGIANVVLEAMSLGLIVISTDCGGMKELINNGENGYLVPVRSSEKIASMIKEIVNLDESRKERVSENAINTIENYFASDRLGKEMICLYEELVDQ